MKRIIVDEDLSVSDQITVENLDELAQLGIKSIICNRPNHEVEDELSTLQIEKHAQQLNIELHYLPVEHTKIKTEDVFNFESAYMSTPKPVHAYCRSGTRAITLWTLMQIKQGQSEDTIIEVVEGAGFDFSKFKTMFSTVRAQLANEAKNYSKQAPAVISSYEIVVVGAGSAGISVASSLLARDKQLKIAVIDPADTHYYQPGFTMVGGGVFDLSQTFHSMESIMPRNVSWIKSAVCGFSPEKNFITLDSGAKVSYERLIVCPGLKLDWTAIEGLAETLGENGVTSNYLPKLSAYTWKLVTQLGAGKAIFTQPPMPIKCAGAPQKAMYLAADHWLKQGKLKDIDVEFFNAGGVLFGVDAYVPALESYIAKYDVKLQLKHKLVKIDGPNKTAWFEHTDSDGEKVRLETHFDMIHVCPPQTAPDFIRESNLVDDAGWVDVDPATLRHSTFSNIWSLGDVTNTPNAKTMAAVRKQAPVVAANIISDIAGKSRQEDYSYDGYGSCPLTVERGKIVLAEFIYQGKLLPSFPKWLIDGTKPSFLAWQLKVWILPFIYWWGMLKGHEWLVKPNSRATR